MSITPAASGSGTGSKQHFKLYVCCRSNIKVLIGHNPMDPFSETTDFVVGDVLKAKPNARTGFARIRIKRHGQRQWVSLCDDKGRRQILEINPPRIGQFNHVLPYDLPLREAQTLSADIVSLRAQDIFDELSTLRSRLLPHAISMLILEYVPWSICVMACAASIFRGHGRFTQFTKPYFHRRDELVEFLRRVQVEHDDLDPDYRSHEAEFAHERRMWREFVKRMRDIDTMDDEDVEEDSEARDNLGHLWHQPSVEEREESKSMTHTGGASGHMPRLSLRRPSLENLHLRDITQQKPGELRPWLKSMFSDLIRHKPRCYYTAELYVMESDIPLVLHDNEALDTNYHQSTEIYITSRHNCRSYTYEPRLIARKSANALRGRDGLLDINESGGSQWFEIHFQRRDASVDFYDETHEQYTIRVGGIWGESAGDRRHWFVISDERKQFRPRELPIVVINAVTSFKKAPTSHASEYSYDY